MLLMNDDYGKPLNEFIQNHGTTLVAHFAMDSRSSANWYKSNQMFDAFFYACSQPDVPNDLAKLLGKRDSLEDLAHIKEIVEDLFARCSYSFDYRLGFKEFKLGLDETFAKNWLAKVKSPKGLDVFARYVMDYLNK